MQADFFKAYQSQYLTKRLRFLSLMIFLLLAINTFLLMVIWHRSTVLMVEKQHIQNVSRVIERLDAHFRKEDHFLES